jgi:hypothetical protein
VFIINLIITIVTNDDPFHNSDYRFYVVEGEIHDPDYKDEIHVCYRFLVLTYTSLQSNIFIKYALSYVLKYLFFYYSVKSRLHVLFIAVIMYATTYTATPMEVCTKYP